MRKIRAKKLWALAAKHHQPACRYYNKKIPFKTFYRWIKKMYVEHTLTLT